jgi:hypothetical protein
MIIYNYIKEVIKSLLRPLYHIGKNHDFYFWKAKYSNELLKFKDLHKGEDCFIIGNGPSLNNTNLSLLKDFHVIGLNKINMIFEKVKLDLSYHVSVNPEVINQIKKDLEDNIFNCPSFIAYNWSKSLTFNNKNVFRIFTSSIPIFGKKLDFPLREGYTVTFVAMQIAFYMGFKNIYLLGVDHNFKQKGNPNEKQIMEDDDENHFHPDYFKGQNWYLADLEGSELSYNIAKYEFAKNESKIIDCTVDGKLKIFQKMKLEDAVIVAKKK